MSTLTKESTILMALFKSTVEQSTYLTNELKHRPKQLFVLWQKMGFQLLEEMEKSNIVNAEYIDSITDIYHNMNLEIRKTNNGL